MYYPLIVSGEKSVELRAQTPYWRSIARHVQECLGRGEEVVGIFACGRDRHYRHVVGAEEDVRALEVLGRPLSDLGAMNLGGPDPHAVMFRLGDAV